MNASFPSKQKISGRREVLEGKRRFIQAIAENFTIDWSQQRYDNADDSQQIRRRTSLAVSTWRRPRTQKSGWFFLARNSCGRNWDFWFGNRM